MISVSTVGLRNWLHCIRCGSRGILRNCLVSVFHWCLMCFNLRMPEPAWISVIGLTAPKFMIYVNFQSSIWDVLGIEFRMVKPNTVFVTSKWVVKLDCTLEDLVNALKLIFINMFFTILLLFSHSCLYENFAAEQWISGLNGCSLHLKWDLEALPLGVGRFLFQFDLMFHLGLILSYSFCFSTMFDGVMVDSLTWFASRSPGWLNFQRSFQCQSNFKS